MTGCHDDVNIIFMSQYKPFPIRFQDKSIVVGLCRATGLHVGTVWYLVVGACSYSSFIPQDIFSFLLYFCENNPVISGKKSIIIG